MAEGSVSERRIRPIQDAAASGNWKQALQLCEKWSKKGEKSEQFLALKATILLKQPDKAQAERGKQDILQLCKRDPAITDVDALQQIQDALRDLSLHTQEGPKLWERAIAKNPQNEDLLTTWLRSSIAESNWLSAQKAAVALRKAFPKERNYEFWKTLFSYLIQQDPTLEDNTRKLFGMLAYRFISKAAETVPKDKDQLLSSPDALQTPEELSLLVTIYLTTGRADEAVKLLSNDTLGVTSRFADEDPGFILQLLLQSLEQAQAWPEAFDFCQSQLASNETLDSALWELMLTALRKSNYSPELVERAQKMTVDATTRFPDDRDSFLAALAIAQSGDTNLSDLCQKFYQKFKSKVSCFDDLRESVGRLDQQERDAFLDVIEKDRSSEDSTQKLLVLKLNFCFRPGLQEKPEELERLSQSALDLYHSCRKDSKACPEVGYLAAVALIKIAQLQDVSKGDGRSTHTEILLQAAVLLTEFQKDQKHGEEYYPYLILLIRVEQLLGLMSLALLNCKKLSVKNIQFESVGYFLFERISTLHPRQVGKFTPSDDNAYSPLEQHDLALEMLERSESTLTQQINSGLRTGTYSNILKAIQMRSDLQRSINREIFAYEHLKIRRLTGLLDEGGHPIPDYPLVDQRDLTLLESYESTPGQSLMDHLQLGPLTKEERLDAMSLYDKLFFYLRSEQQSQPGMSEKAMAMLEAALEKCDKHSEQELDLQLTKSEAENLLLHKTMARLIVQTKSTPTKETQSEDLTPIERWLTSQLSPPQQDDGLLITMRGISIPTWNFLHASFTALETLQAISLFLSVASAGGKKKKPSSSSSSALSLPKELVSKMQSLVGDAEKAIHQRAKDVKNTLNEAGVLGKIVDVVAGRSEDGGQQSGMGEAIERQGDTAMQEILCGEMKEAWEDALDGVIACKVVVYK